METSSIAADQPATPGRPEQLLQMNGDACPSGFVWVGMIIHPASRPGASSNHPQRWRIPVRPVRPVRNGQSEDTAEFYGVDMDADFVISW